MSASVSPALATAVGQARRVAWRRRRQRSVGVPWSAWACVGVAAAAAVLLAALAGQVEAIGAGPIALPARWFGGAAILPAGRFIALLIVLLVAEYLCRRARGLPNTGAMYTRYYAGTRSPTVCARPGSRSAAQ